MGRHEAICGHEKPVWDLRLSKQGVKLRSTCCLRMRKLMEQTAAAVPEHSTFENQDRGCR